MKDVTYLKDIITPRAPKILRLGKKILKTPCLKFQPERSKREDSSKDEMRCSEH